MSREKTNILVILADQLHGFEKRLTTDIYPADFNWTGDWTEL